MGVMAAVLVSAMGVGVYADNDEKKVEKQLDKTEKQGFTLIPLKFYTKGSLVKLEIGLAKGKKKGDKKRSLIEAQEKRDIQRDLKTQKR